MLGVVAPTPTRHRLTCIVVALALLVTACGTSVPPAAPAIDSARGPIQDMLRDRAMALRDGDIEGYLQGLSPEARAFEAPIAERAMSLPLADIDLTIGDAVISDDGNRFSDAEIAFIYRYEDLPEDNLFRFGFLYDLERTGGAWVVTESEIDPDERLYPPPWATGPVELADSEHFLAMTRPGVAGVEEMLALAERAREQLAAKLTLEPDPRHLVLLAADEEQFLDMAGPDAAGAAAVAKTSQRPTAAYTARIESREMVVNLESVLDPRAVRVRHEGRADAVPVEVFEHELAHLALSRFTRRATPKWVVEGAAMLLADEVRTEAWAVMLEDGSLDERSLGTLLENDDMGALEYAYSNAAVLYLVEMHGEETFFEFYQNFKEFNIAGGGDDIAGGGDEQMREDIQKGAERLLVRYYRFGVEELDGFTRAYIRRAI